MRRYTIISGIFLILSIIDLALAAPVAYVNVVDAPEDTITTLGKRGDEVEQLFDKWYFEGLWGKPKQSPTAHASSSSMPSGSEPPGSAPSGSEQPGSEPSGLAPSGSAPAPSGSGPSSSIPLGPDHGSTNVVGGPAQGSGLPRLTSLVPILWRPDRWSKNVVGESSGSVPSGPVRGSTSVIDGPAQGSGLSRLSSSAPIPIPPPNPESNHGHWVPRPSPSSSSSSDSSWSSSSSGQLSSGSEELFDWEPEGSEPLKGSQALPPGGSVSNWDHKSMKLYTIPEEPWGFTEEDYNSEHEHVVSQPPSPPPLVPGSLTMPDYEELYRPPSSPVSSSNLDQPVNAGDVQAALYSWRAKGKQSMDATQ